MSRVGDNSPVTKCIKILDKNVLAELKGNVSFYCFKPPGSGTCAISSAALLGLIWRWPNVKTYVSM